MNTNKHNPGGHERKIVTKLQNMEKNNRVVAPVGGKGVSQPLDIWSHLSSPGASK